MITVFKKVVQEHSWISMDGNRVDVVKEHKSYSNNLHLSSNGGVALTLDRCSIHTTWLPDHSEEEWRIWGPCSSVSVDRWSAYSFFKNEIFIFLF